MTGRATFDDKTIAFNVASSHDLSATVESVVVVMADITRIRALSMATIAATRVDSGRGQAGIIPEELRVEGGLTLTSSKLVDTRRSGSALTIWIAYEAEENGRKSKALCRLARLQWHTESK